MAPRASDGLFVFLYDATLDSKCRDAAAPQPRFWARSSWPRFTPPTWNAWNFSWRLRRRGISDQAVLRAMDEVPREHFVVAEFIDSAYADQALPIACGQTISQPYVVAYMTEQLEVEPQPSRARDRHRLGLPGRHSVAAGARSREHRALPDVGRHCARPPQDAGLRQRHRSRRRRICRRAGAGAVRPHHRHRRRRRGAAKRWSISLPKAARWCCRSVRATARSISSSSPRRRGGLTRQNLIAVRFVPLLPGQAREL